MKAPHSEKIEAVTKALKTSKKGLSKGEAALRLRRYGLNEIKRTKKVSLVKIFLSQFNSILIWILLAAVIISLVLWYFFHHGDGLRDAIVIAVILVINAILGFIQEYKAEKSIEALRKLTALKVRVIRGGKEQVIAASAVVPGDIVVLEEGAKVPADARLIECHMLDTQEASLTGESTPVTKELSVLKPDTPLADRHNMVFSGTVVTKGRATAVVTAIGMKTEVGKIADMLQEIEEEKTPLQQKLSGLAKTLGIITVIVALVVLFSGLGRGEKFVEMFLIAVALAVAAIPEGLPAVVTISLSLGIQRMIKKNALIRRLPSVETLGSTTVICSDKTGTLTLNQMTVRKIFANREEVDVTGGGYSTKGKFSTDPKKLNMLLKIGLLCNNAKLEDNNAIGDPTEAALIVSAAKAGMVKSRVEAKEPRVGEVPFSSESKMMVTYHKVHGRTYAYVKGAPDVILEKCDRMYINGMVRKLSRMDKAEITKKINELASDALRVLGFAFSDTEKLVDGEQNLVFVGLQGMIDPPRVEAKDSIKKCRSAGIKVVMITGDHRATATAIGRQLGLKGRVLTGKDVESIKNLSRIVEDVSIYARVNPAHKLKIIEALKKNGHIVAMTGDGVNDAPALKAADIGVAMGITGTDVSKEASDMILTDDNFVSIVGAVEEGRNIYDNIKKFVGYLLSANIAEVLIIFLATLLGWPLPLIAVQLLWINLVTDGLPALALGVDNPDKDIMGRKPRDPKEHILSKNLVIKMLFLGSLVTVFVLGMFYNELALGLVRAQTVAFTLLVVLELVVAYLIRANYHLGLFSNKKLLLAVVSSFLLQILVVYLPWGNKFFSTTPLLFMDWVYMIVLCAALAGMGYVGDRIINRFTRHID